MVLVNMGQELKVNRVEGQFLTIVVYLWQFKFKIAKIPNIRMEVDFYLEVEKTLKLVLTKIIICMQLQGLLLKNSHIQIQVLI